MRQGGDGETGDQSQVTNYTFTREALHYSCKIFAFDRLHEADKEVQEAYKKIALSRSKKKSPSKKEKEVAWKALKDREAILKQLESV